MITSRMIYTWSGRLAVFSRSVAERSNGPQVWKPAQRQTWKSAVHDLASGSGEGGRWPARGFVLILVLVVIMMASMVAASLLFVLKAEQTSSAAGDSGEQAWAAAMSGVYQAMRAAADAEAGSVDWQDNPALFHDRLVYDDGGRKWYFSVYTMADGLRYGLADEAGKINLHHASATMLEALPNLTPTLAQNLLGALARLAPAPLATPPPDSLFTETAASTNAASGSLSCLDELLFVSGVTPRLLYGGYGNALSRLDTPADARAGTAPADYSDVQPDTGWRQFLTVSSYDLNVNNEGTPRLNLNQSDADLSRLNLGTNTLAYLAAMRTNHQALAHPVELLEATNKFAVNQTSNVVLRTDIGKADLPALLDLCTATNLERLVGLINLNTASAKVLAALPGMNDAQAEAIVSAREGLSPEARKTPAWLYQEGLVNADIFKKVVPYLTTRSYQFRFQVAAYAVPAGAYRVVEVVVDAAVKPPVILSLRDLTRLGVPPDLEAKSGKDDQVAAKPSGGGRVARRVSRGDPYGLTMREGIRAGFHSPGGGG